jgi:hypothetical protein
VKRHRSLRQLVPDRELIRRRAAGETFRELASDYGVSHTTLSRYFARPEVGKQLKRAEQLQRAEQRAAEARWRAERKAERERERAARRRARQPPAPVSEDRRRRDGAAHAGRSRFDTAARARALLRSVARLVRGAPPVLTDRHAERQRRPPRHHAARRGPRARAPTRILRPIAALGPSAPCRRMAEPRHASWMALIR